MATTLDIINSALSEAGARPIENVDTPSSTTEKVAASIYPQIFKTLLGSFNWPFASTWARLELEEDEDQYHPEYNRFVDLPADLVSLWEVRAARGWQIDEYEVLDKHDGTGKVLASNHHVIAVNYTREVLTDSYSQTYTQALIFKLAASLSVPLATNDSRRAELLRDANYWERMARNEASKQKRSRSALGANNSAILQARNGYGPI